MWVLVVAVGLVALWDYGAAPGASATPPQYWPTGSGLTSGGADTGPRLVMLAHPRCPCTRASLGELSRLVAQAPPNLDIDVLFTVPTGGGESWTTSDLWKMARAIPGARVTPDVGGREAARFGVRTSGQVLLYESRGSLVFHGGITAARGHEGESTGRQAILDWLWRREAQLADTPVFGCEVVREAAVRDPAARSSDV